MLKYLKQFQEATPATKEFFFNAALYLVIILGIGIFAYARLDWVRSYDQKQGKYKEQQYESTVEQADKAGSARG